LFIVCDTASAQNYPTRPLRIITVAAGGGADLTARLVGNGIGGTLGQQVVVDNRGGGTIAIELAQKSPPDGYTLLAYGSPLWLTPLMRSAVTFDYERDFAPIVLATSAPFFLYVHPSLPVKTVRELTALAKAKPGALNYATAGTGSATHLTAELFKARAGVDIVRVTYKGGGPAAQALLTGEVQVEFGTASVGLPQVKTGRVRVLAVTSAKPSALAPDVPTMASAGLPGFEANLITGMFAPAKTPAAIVERLNQEINHALAREDVKEKLLAAGLEPVGGTPDQLSAAIKAEYTTLGKVIKDVGIRDE
jgi:tripartite-type tricarboxylate transporter receptor subunit TctC